MWGPWQNRSKSPAEQLVIELKTRPATSTISTQPRGEGGVLLFHLSR